MPSKLIVVVVVAIVAADPRDGEIHVRVEERVELAAADGGERAGERP